MIVCNVCTQEFMTCKLTYLGASDQLCDGMVSLRFYLRHMLAGRSLALLVSQPFSESVHQPLGKAISQSVKLKACFDENKRGRVKIRGLQKSRIFLGLGIVMNFTI